MSLKEVGDHIYVLCDTCEKHIGYIWIADSHFDIDCLECFKSVEDADEGYFGIQCRRPL